MTVKLTYGYAGGFVFDGDTTSGWTESRANMLAGDAVESVVNGDYFHISATFDEGVTNEWCCYEKDVTNFDGDVYNKFFVRYRTGSSSAGARVKVVVVFTVGDQTILDLSYSTSWALASGTLTAGKTVDKIQIYADDDGSDGTFWVEVDQILICKGQFTLANTKGGVHIDFQPREAMIPIPSKDADHTQNLGSHTVVELPLLDLMQGTWKRSGDTVDGEVFLDVLHNRSSEPWQWLDTGDFQFKVSVHPVFTWTDEGLTVHLTLNEYSLGNKGEETYLERWGIGL